MKKLILLLSLSIFSIVPVISTVSCTGIRFNPSNPNPVNPGIPDYVDILEVGSKNLELNLSTLDQFNTYNKQYSLAYQENAKAVKEINDDPNFQPDKDGNLDPDTKTAMKVFSTLYSIHKNWYKSISSYCSINSFLKVNNLTLTTNWDQYATINTLPVLIRLFSLVYDQKQALNNFNKTWEGMKENFFSDKDIYPKDFQDQRKQDEEGWERVTDSVNDFYCLPIINQLNSIILAILNVEPNFNQDILSFDEFNDFMNNGEKQFIQIQNYQTIISKYENLTITFDNTYQSLIQKLDFDKEIGTISIQLNNFKNINDFKDYKSFKINIKNNDPNLDQIIEIETL